MESFTKQGTAGVWQYNVMSGSCHWLHTSSLIKDLVNSDPGSSCNFFLEEDRAQLDQLVDLVVAEAQIKRCVLKARGKLDTPLAFYCMVIPVTDNGRVTKVLGIISELNEVWSNLMRLNDGADIFRTILANIPIDLVIFDAQHRFLYISEVAIKDQETREWLIGKTEIDYILKRNKPASIAEHRQHYFRIALQEKRNVTYEEELEREGKRQYKMRAFHPIMDDLGEVQFVIGYGYDITRVRESEDVIARLNLAVTSTKDGIAILDQEGRYLYLNKAHIEMFGYTHEEELKGKTWRAIYAPEEIERLETQVFPLLIEYGSWSGETVALTKQGGMVHEEITLTTLPDGGLICICRDINERKKQENELRKLALVVENTQSIVIITDLHYRIEWVNKAFTELMEYTVEDVVGKTPGELLTGENTCQTTLRYIEEMLLKKQSFSCEIINYSKSGKAYWVNVNMQPLFDEKGTLVKYFAIQENITYRKQMERDLILAKEAAEASATSKRRFLANMSHEIRTPMNAVIGFTELMMKTALTNEQQFYIETIQSAANNLLIVINDILDLSKIEEGKFQLEQIPVNIGEVVNRAVTVLQLKSEEKGIGLEVNMQLDAARQLLGDPYRLNQILLNVIGNAVKFTEKGKVVVRCQVKALDDEESMLVLDVEDTGIGMSKEMLGKVFQGFQQGDESFVRKYGGTGLGLSISRSLVKLMKGELRISSQLGTGTQVHIEIPLRLASETDENRDQHAPFSAPSLKDRSVLLVEDNHLNAMVASLMMKNAGIRVETAVNGQEACNKLRDQRYDLVLMDIQMPVMDGVDATRLIRQNLLLTMPIVALTAHALREEKDIYLNAGMDDFLTKPYKEEELLTILKKWLN